MPANPYGTPCSFCHNPDRLSGIQVPNPPLVVTQLHTGKRKILKNQYRITVLKAFIKTLMGGISRGGFQQVNRFKADTICQMTGILPLGRRLSLLGSTRIQNGKLFGQMDKGNAMKIHLASPQKKELACSHLILSISFSIRFCSAAQTMQLDLRDQG
jgi:hypothetical protein